MSKLVVAVLPAALMLAGCQTVIGTNYAPMNQGVRHAQAAEAEHHHYSAQEADEMNDFVAEHTKPVKRHHMQTVPVPTPRPHATSEHHNGAKKLTEVAKPKHAAWEFWK